MHLKASSRSNATPQPHPHPHPPCNPSLKHTSLRPSLSKSRARESVRQVCLRAPLTQEGVDQAADPPHGPEEDLGQLLEAGQQHHLVRDAAGAQELLLELGSGAHDGWVAQVHRVAVGDTHAKFGVARVGVGVGGGVCVCGCVGRIPFGFLVCLFVCLLGSA